MLKKSALRRIMVSTLALVIAGVLYFFPNNEENIPLVQNIEYVSANETPIYLLNPDLYVVRTNMATQNTDSLQLIKELVEGLTMEMIKKNIFLNIFPKLFLKIPK